MSRVHGHQFDDTDEYKEWQRSVGERVCIGGVKQGVLRYFGRTNFAQGYWCGVELDEPVGKNNGTVNGVAYFSSKPNHGIFAPVTKISKLNDLSWGGSEVPSSNQDPMIRHTSWDYNFGHLPEVDSSKNFFIKNSISDPSSLRVQMKASIPHCSESFPHDKRIASEHRVHMTLDSSDIRNFDMSNLPSNHTKPHSRSTSLNGIKSSSSSRSLIRYGYGKKNQYSDSNGADRSENVESLVKPRGASLPSSKSSSEIPCRNGGSNNQQSIGLAAAMEEYEKFINAPSGLNQVSLYPEGKRFNERPHFDFKSHEAYLRHDFSDIEDDADNDDQMSIDYDESLGILSPSQMKDLALCPDFHTSSSDVKGLEFPSSESFDDINELPEDEQLHNVSVHYLSESSSRNLEISKQKYSESRSNNFTVIGEGSNSESLVRRTDDFLYSISKKDFNGFNNGSHCTKTEVLNESRSTSQNFNQIRVIKDLSVNDKIFDCTKNYPDKYFDVNIAKCDTPGNVTSIQNGSGSSFSQYASLPTKQNKSDMCHINSDRHNLIDNSTIKDIPLKNCLNTKTNPKINDTEHSGDSFLHVECETTKEKLTVSWEDCLSHDNENMLTSIERPESVYTVGSNDTGFHEDGDLEGDGGMATSIDSTDDAKRLSMTSRDSCIVSDEVDAYKILESNSTSGYSTGLSDSCCNDRPEDDLSSKRFTDEEIPDQCDSEDAFSFQDISISKDADILNAEMSDITTDAETALCNNSTSEALCETMVEDSTLSEIHNLLLSPEESKSPTAENKQTNDISPQPAAYETNESNSVQKGEGSVTPSKCTPEKASNSNPKSNTQLKKVSSSPTNKQEKVSKVNEDADTRRQVPKSPKKNVISKIKAMIESTSNKTATKSKTDVPDQAPRRTVSAPKKSRWDAVTSKIAASLAEEKTKPKTKRDIRSRVDTNLTTARQLTTACQSPKCDSPRLSNGGEGSMSPRSGSSRDRRVLSERNSAQEKDGKGKMTKDTKSRPKSPRPGKTYVTSRSNSPVAASESSATSISINSHNSHFKLAHWKGSNSTIASSVPPPKPVLNKRVLPIVPNKTVVQNTNRTAPIKHAKKPSTVPKIRITPAAPTRSISPAAPRGGRMTKEQAGVRGPTHATKPVRPPMWLSKAELTQEIQRLGNLCEARTKELNRLKMETKHVTVGFDAFAALFKYMVEDLNALSVPVLHGDLEKTLKQLELTKQDLAYYEREVEEMKAHHCQELNDLSNKLFEVYQGEITELSVKHQEELDLLKLDHQKQIDSISSTFNSCSEEAQVKHEAVVLNLQQELTSQREELQLFQEKEIKDLEEKHAQSSKTLQEHIEQIQKKCVELKQHSMGMEEAMRKDTDTKLQWVSSRKSDLEKEVESLKAVLEMKNKELHSLRVQTLEMEKQLEDLPLAREKIKMLQARAEDLEALMVEKTKLERKLSKENHQIKDTYERESKVNRRLSMENEELQWRIRQAEHSIVSGSFSEVPEYQEEEEEEAGTPTSPTKSPSHQVVSRSVFFTFMDKDDSSSPRTPYKKITPSFSAGYRTSPSKSSKSTPGVSPYRSKSHSDPPVLCSTPRKVTRQSSAKQKKRDSGKLTPDDGKLSVANSMTSSVSSESSVFGQKETLLEEHEDEIRESLEILLEQRSAEMASGDSKSADESPNFESADMSRSAEFSDPKTYYHMTFSVLKEACDTEEKVLSPENSSEDTTLHSMKENNGHLEIVNTQSLLSDNGHDQSLNSTLCVAEVQHVESLLSKENVKNIDLNN